MTAFTRFARTPKGILTLILATLAAVAGRVEGMSLVLPGVVSAVGTAIVLDAVQFRRRRGRWAFPQGAMLTGLLIALILNPFSPWHVFAAASAIAVLSKHAVRTRAANVFNPAAVGLFAVYYLFDAGHSWWGSLPGIMPAAAMPLLIASDVVVVRRIRKQPLVLAFLACHFICFTAVSLVGDAALVADVFVPPDLNAALFFAGFMITDPPTSPTRLPDQVACGAIVAVASFLVFVYTGLAHYLLSGVLVGNVFEAALRVRRARRARVRSQAR